MGAPRLAWYDYFATLSDREGAKYCHNPALSASQCTSASLQGHVSMNDTFAAAPLRDLARAYAAAISLVDEQFGKIVMTVDELALAENTILMFVGDHGQNLGVHSPLISRCHCCPHCLLREDTDFGGTILVAGEHNMFSDYCPDIISLQNNATNLVVCPYLVALVSNDDT